MEKTDTEKLLSECSAGVKMGIDSIEEVQEQVTARRLKALLSACRDEHEKLGRETDAQLKAIGAKGKNPNPAAKSMSWMKTEVKLAVDPSDATVASLMTDGCNMGIKSLTRYLNQYGRASKSSKDLARRIIESEEGLVTSLKEFL